jgi:hypothetical protein
MNEELMKDLRERMRSPELYSLEQFLFDRHWWLYLNDASSTHPGAAAGMTTIQTTEARKNHHVACIIALKEGRRIHVDNVATYPGLRTIFKLGRNGDYAVSTGRVNVKTVE